MSAVVDLPEEHHPDRVRLRFLQSGEDRAVKEARVLAGTTIFDAASWNGVAVAQFSHAGGKKIRQQCCPTLAALGPHSAPVSHSKQDSQKPRLTTPWS